MQTDNITLGTTNISGLSGNEMYCVDLLGYKPGNLLVGNSVFSMGLIGGLRSSVRGIVGGEISQYTEIIQEGRRLSFERLEKERQTYGGLAVTGVTSELVFHGTNIEFLSVGSIINSEKVGQAANFTTSSDGQELFSQVDAGYDPVSFVFGNVAYSIGVGKGILGSFKKLARGEVKQYSDIFNTTRHLALDRIRTEAFAQKANSVIGIRTSILPFGGTGVQEMVMVGTASNKAGFQVASADDVITSDLTAEEMWNITKLGYSPQQLVLGTSVYSLGFIGGIGSALQGLVKGEINGLTELIYNAREESMKKVQSQAAALGADDVLGVKTYIYRLGNNLIEFLAIGTAVKKDPTAKTKSAQLPPQAIIRDKNTFVNTAEYSYGVNLNR